MGRKSKGVTVDTFKGRSRARWTRLGQRLTVYLGPVDDQAVCHASLARLHARLADDPLYLPNGSKSDLLVSDIVRDFMAAFEGSEASRRSYKLSLIRLAKMHGPLPVADFGPLAFNDWLTHGITAYRQGRAAVDKARRHVLRAWQWAVSRERIGEGLYRALTAVKIPKRAKASEVRHPAPEASIREALPFMPAPVAALLRVQLATGARPSEIIGLRPCDLIREGSYTVGGIVYAVPAGGWVLVVSKSKTGKPRVIHIGPAAIDVLQGLLRDRPADRCFFRPADVWKGEGRGENYSPGGYARAVRNACIKAGVPTFSPYQCRHFYKQRVLSALGSDHAKAGLGHSSPAMTARYAAGVLDSERAAEAARLPAAV